MIPHSMPSFDAGDAQAVCAVLARGFVTHGTEARRLGAMGAELMGKRWGIAVQSGTDALTLALHLAGVRAGMRVAVPAYICAAPLDALALLGAVPVPVDIARDTLAIDPEAVNAVDPAPDAVVAAHLFGIPAPVEEISCTPLIEDCAQTLGIRAGDRPAGARGVVSVCSLYGTKLLASGHGGVLAGDDPALEAEAWALLLHDKQDTWRPRFHFLMSDLAAALGVSQAAKLSAFIQRRRALAACYAEALGAPRILAECAYSRFLTVCEDGDAMRARLAAAGIASARPVHRPLFMLAGCAEKDYPAAAWAHRHLVSVPLYPAMGDGDAARIVAFLKEHARALDCWPPA